MADKTDIQWTEHTFNPWWGCVHVSEGCANCYAATLAKRYGFDVWGRGKKRRLLGASAWAEPERWNRAAERRGEPARVFCASMADVFMEGAPTHERDRLWALIEETPWLTWQLLTKRPENVSRLLPDSWLDDPRPNVWLGTSVEHQRWVDVRVPQLLETPAVVHFLSCEPLLGPLDISRYLGGESAVDWVICGGESGAGARPMHPAWARSLRDQCAEAQVPFFFKQFGNWVAEGDLPPRTKLPKAATSRVLLAPSGESSSNVAGPLREGWARMVRLSKHVAGRTLDGRTWDEFPDAWVPDVSPAGTGSAA